MKKLLIALLALSSFNAIAAEKLTCELLDNEESVMDYFKEIKYSTPVSKELENDQIRKAVKNYYGYCGPKADYDDYCYRDDMSDQEVDDLGEGVYASTRAGKDGTLYTVVNVGFGGGNSSNYFFKFGTMKMYKIMVIDGSDCGPIVTR